MRKRAMSYLLPGLVVLVLLFGMTGPARADSVNLVVNGTFDTNLDGWTTSGSGNDPPGVTWILETARVGQPGTPGNSFISQAFSFSGTDLSISFSYEWQVNKPVIEDFFTAELLYDNTAGGGRGHYDTTFE